MTHPLKHQINCKECKIHIDKKILEWTVVRQNNWNEQHHKNTLKTCSVAQNGDKWDYSKPWKLSTCYVMAMTMNKMLHMCVWTSKQKKEGEGTTK